MRWHKIADDVVLLCLTAPRLQEPAEKGKTHSWVQMPSGEFLRVTWIRESRSIIVVTVLTREKPPRGWTP